MYLSRLVNGYQHNLSRLVNGHQHNLSRIVNGHQHKALFSPKETKDVTEIILGLTGDISTARLLSIRFQFAC